MNLLNSQLSTGLMSMGKLKELWSTLIMGRAWSQEIELLSTTMLTLKNLIKKLKSHGSMQNQNKFNLSVVLCPKHSQYHRMIITSVSRFRKDKHIIQVKIISKAMKGFKVIYRITDLQREQVLR